MQLANEGRVAAYKWQLQASKITGFPSGREDDFVWRRKQFPVYDSESSIRLDQTILPGGHMLEEIQLGLWLRPAGGGTDQVLREVEDLARLHRASIPHRHGGREERRDHGGVRGQARRAGPRGRHPGGVLAVRPASPSASVHSGTTGAPQLGARRVELVSSPRLCVHCRSGTLPRERPKLGPSRWLPVGARRAKRKELPPTVDHSTPPQLPKALESLSKHLLVFDAP